MSNGANWLERIWDKGYGNDLVPLNPMESRLRDPASAMPKRAYTKSELDYINGAKNDNVRALRTKMVDRKKDAYADTGVSSGKDYIQKAGGEYSGLTPDGVTVEDVMDAQKTRYDNTQNGTNWNAIQSAMKNDLEKDGFTVTKDKNGRTIVGNEYKPVKYYDYIGKDGIVHERFEKNDGKWGEQSWNPAIEGIGGAEKKNDTRFKLEFTPDEQKQIDDNVKLVERNFNESQYSPEDQAEYKKNPKKVMEKVRFEAIQNVLNNKKGGPKNEAGYYHNIDPKTGMDRTNDITYNPRWKMWEGNTTVAKEWLNRHPEEENAPKSTNRTKKWYEIPGMLPSEYNALQRATNRQNRVKGK